MAQGFRLGARPGLGFLWLCICKLPKCVLIFTSTRLHLKTMPPLVPVFRKVESSAAAIAASGLLNLAKMVQDPVHAARYRQAALVILDTLTGPDYLANETPGWEGILKHGIYHLNKGLGVDESVMWGEYFFVEALDKALALEE